MSNSFAGNRAALRKGLRAAGIAAVLLTLPPSARANTIDVAIQSFQFTGQHLSIRLGDTVRWTNYDGTTHTATEGTDYVLNGNEAFHHPFPPGSPPASTTFDAAFLAANPRPGNRYDYFCVPHGAAMTGSITVYSGPGDFFCFCEPLGPCSNRDYGAGCSNSNPGWRGARMVGIGSASAGADDLQLLVDLLPPNKTCLPFRGTSLVGQTQMGEGWRCIGPPLTRLAALDSGAGGAIAIGPGIVAGAAGGHAPISAGETWLFQVWYRDAPSPCGHSTNVSNGYSVAFVP
jgi:plastocyanin